MAEHMNYTQLFRGTALVAAYPGHSYQEIFKLQDTTAEPTINEITISDPTRIGLPTYDSVSTVSEIVINGEAVDFSPQAAAVVMYGSVANTPSGDKVDEEHDASIDRVIVLDSIPLDVTKVSDADDIEYFRNTDYSMTHAGIRVLPGGDLAAKIEALIAGPGALKSLPLKISYSYPSVDIIKPFIEGQKYYRVVFGQINEAGNNERRRIRCFYCKISLNGGIPLNQGTDFGTIPVKISLLADPNIDDAGEASMWEWMVERK
ncbi:MAG: hypothetical protein RBR45_11755 [Pseudomonas sp.]|nr:hypothetical protein [Pseudomonas sp.]